MFDSASDELGIPQVAIFDDDPLCGNRAFRMCPENARLLGVADAVGEDVPIFSRRGRTRVSWKHE